MMVNTANQMQSKRKKKFTGGNASKRHRDRVNIEFNNLAKLLPFPENVIAKLDKSSILRLAVSYIRAKSFFKDALPLNEDEQANDKSKLPNDDMLYKGILEETCLTEFFLQALDGFLIVITEDLKVLYVSESVREYLGYCQAGIIHESFLQFIHWGDEDNIKNALRFDTSQNSNTALELQANERRNSKFGNDDVKKPKNDLNGKKDLNDKREINEKAPKSTFSSRIQSRRFVCRMKCAFSCSSRFYTAFQAFQFSGHVRRSTIQEGKEQRTLNTLIAFGCPLNNSKIDPRDLISDGFDEMRSFDDADPNGPNVKMIGLHIEPRLRPHIAPIPIAQNEPDSKANNQSPHQYPFRRFNMGTHPDAHFNSTYSHGERLGAPYHRIAAEYYRDGLRFANGWNGRPSSLSNSPISDASSPRGIKRSASADGSPESSDTINGRKLSRFEGPPYAQNQNGFKGLPLDDIHSSAKILMQLKSTQRRYSDNGHIPNESESDSGSSDDRGEICRDAFEYPSKDPFFINRPYPPVMAAKFHTANGYAFDVDRRADSIPYEANDLSFRRRLGDKPHRFFDQYDQNSRRYSEEYIRERIIQCKLSPNGFKDNLSYEANLKTSRLSPERISKSQIYMSRYSPINGIQPTSQSPPKKESNRGFHISTILGLKDDTTGRVDVAGQQGGGEANGHSRISLNTEENKTDIDLEKHEFEIGRNRRPAVIMTSNSSADREAGAERRLPEIEVTCIRGGRNSKDRGANGHDEDDSAILLDKNVSNMDDIKTSFAHLLQGFTATITRSIDKSIDTIFRP